MNKLKNQTKNLLFIAIVTLGSILIWLGAVATSNMIDDSLFRHIAFGSIVTTFTLALLYGILHLSDGKSFKFIFGKHNLRAFLIGVSLFTIPAIITLVAFILFGFIEITPQASFADIAGTLLLVAGLVFISEALPEELIFRGYIFKKLSSFTKAWLTIILQAVLFLVFAFFIGATGDLLDASFLLTFAITLGIVRAATGSVWAAIGFHLACMTFQQGFGSAWSLFGVSDPSTLQTLIFAMIPFSVTIAIFVGRIKWSKQST